MNGLPRSEYITSVDEVMWGIALIAITMAVHGFGMILTLDMSRNLWQRPERTHSFVYGLGHLVLASWVIITVHLVEVSVWAAFFAAKGALPNYSTAFYFSLMEYTTVGSSFKLPDDWRLLGGMIAMAGLMTFAWSTGVLCTVAQDFQSRQLKLIAQRREKRQPRRLHAEADPPDSAA